MSVEPMSRRFTIVTVTLTAIVAFLVGAIVAGGFGQPSVTAENTSVARKKAAPMTGRSNGRVPATLVSFADVVENINPAVVNIDATTRAPESSRRRRSRPDLPEVPNPFNGGLPNVPRNDRDQPRRGAGSGFIIDADGSIL